MDTRLAGRIAARLTLADTRFGARGFPLEPDTVRRHLEERAEAFVGGAHAYGRIPRDPHRALAEVTPDLRGFAYEGAAMVAALVDLARPASRHLSELLGGPGHAYRHLVHVGVGWAMSVARVGRPIWWGCLDPLLRWLAYDGAGFAATFFGLNQSLARLASDHDRPERQVWASGVGRALWFTETGDLARITARIGSARPEFRPSLWAGVGLASVYAGSPEAVAGTWCPSLRGANAAALRQGMAFGVTAALAHDALDARSAALYEALSGEPVEAAARRTDATSADLYRCGTPIGHFELWRSRLREPTTVALDLARAARATTPTQRAESLR